MSVRSGLSNEKWAKGAPPVPLMVVGVSPIDGGCPIDLFQEEDSAQFVGQSHGAQTET